MERKAELEARLVSLRRELETVEGGPTEVYSRIVGYYRSVRNWNAGKREEYHARRTYLMPQEEPVRAVPVAAPVALAVAAGKPSPVLKAALSQGLSQASLGLETAADLPAPAKAAHGASRSGILVFTRKACPNCPPVADYVTKGGFPAIFVDVDGEEGLALARRHGILATPTVLGLDGEGHESFRACGLGELKARLPASV